MYLSCGFLCQKLLARLLPTVADFDEKSPEKVTSAYYSILRVLSCCHSVVGGEGARHYPGWLLSKHGCCVTQNSASWKNNKRSLHTGPSFNGITSILLMNCQWTKRRERVILWQQALLEINCNRTRHSVICSDWSEPESRLKIRAQKMKSGSSRQTWMERTDTLGFWAPDGAKNAKLRLLPGHPKSLHEQMRWWLWIVWYMYCSAWWDVLISHYTQRLVSLLWLWSLILVFKVRMVICLVWSAVAAINQIYSLPREPFYRHRCCWQCCDRQEWVWPPVCSSQWNLIEMINLQPRNQSEARHEGCGQWVSGAPDL